MDGRVRATACGHGRRRVGPALGIVVAVVAALLGAAPADGQAEPSPHPSFVRAAYRDLWAVTLDEGLVADEAAMLDAGDRSRGELLQSLASTRSAMAGDVDHAYLLALHRHASSADRNRWVQAFYFGPRTYGDLVGTLFASSEYERRFGDGTTGGWVDRLYLDLLGRPADPSGRAYWVALAERSGRGVAARRMHAGLESRRHRVRSWYLELLGRPADPGGLDHWAARNPGSDRPVILGLARTQRYVDHAQERFPAPPD